MSDAAVTNLVTGLVTIVTIIAGVVTLWLKMREAARLAAGAKVAAAEATAIGVRTEQAVAVVSTATNGDRDRMRAQLDALHARVEALHAAALAREQELPPRSPPPPEGTRP